MTDLLTPTEVAAERGVTEIVHFTTDTGVMGFLVKGALLSRQGVGSDPDLAFIFLNVWPLKVPEWAGHISLSISRINRDLFDRAEKNLPDHWWAVLSFDPEILDHDGVVFATTNNSYVEVCRRAGGVEGFADLFSQEVPWGHYGSVHTRNSGTPRNWTTDIQAEVLYPTAIPIGYLQRIYVQLADHRRLIKAWCSAFEVAEPDIEVQPEMFS
jgi:hypothetical protein